MLNAIDMSLMVQVRSHLGRCKCAGAAALEQQVDALLGRHAAHAASVAAAASARPKAAKGGAPALLYIVEVEPGWVERCHGAAAARQAAADAVQRLGARAFVPEQASMAATMAKAGHWFKLVETDNGQVGITVRKATAAEIAAHAEYGTDIAPSKTHAKKAKTT